MVSVFLLQLVVVDVLLETIMKATEEVDVGEWTEWERRFAEYCYEARMWLAGYCRSDGSRNSYVPLRRIGRRHGRIVAGRVSEKLSRIGH